MQEQLPPELLDDIFVLLRNSSDLVSLRACSQANSSFRALAEPHLYCHLALASGESSGSLESFTSPHTRLSPAHTARYLLERPHIAGYVRSLEIDIDGSHLTERSTAGDEHLAQILLSLTNLERIMLKNDLPGRGHGIFWSKMHTVLRSAFVQTLNFPSIKEVGLQGIRRFPLDILCGLTALETVSLCGYPGSFTYSAPELASSIGGKGCLKSLTLDYCFHTLEEIIAWLYSSAGPDISQLKYLKVHPVKPSDYRHLPFILSLCSRSLEVLELDPAGQGDLGYTSASVVGRERNLPWRLLENYPLPERPFVSNPSSLSITVDRPTTIPLHSDLLPETISVSMHNPFSLKRLSSLKHLILHLRITELDQLESYSATFEWTRRVFIEFQGPEAASNDLTSTTAPISSNSCQNRVALERLTLNILFNIAPDLLHIVSWSPLYSSLASLSSSMPSLENIDIIATAGEIYIDQDEVGDGEGKIVSMLEEDADLAPLLRKGLVRVLSK